MVQVKFTANPQKLITRLNGIKGKVTIGLLNAANEIKEIGKLHAKALAPKHTGDTSRMIRGIVRNQGDGVKIQILSPNRTKHEYAGRRFNLPVWMHVSDRAASHIKTGDRKYMFTTQRYLNNISGEIVRNNIKLK